jgi:hypothetical protein
MLVGWDVNMHNCVAWHAKQLKARRGNQREDNQRVKKKEAKEVEGGGAVGAVFFHVFNFFPLNISYKNPFFTFLRLFYKTIRNNQLRPYWCVFLPSSPNITAILYSIQLRVFWYINVTNGRLTQLHSFLVSIVSPYK